MEGVGLARPLFCMGWIALSHLDTPFHWAGYPCHTLGWDSPSTLDLDSPFTLGYLLHWAEYPCHTLGWIALPHLVLVALAHLDIPLSLGWVLLSHFGLDSPSTLAMHLVFLSGQVSSSTW